MPIKSINENFNTTDVKSIYGLTKLFSEQLIKEINYTFNVKYIINRFGVISGPWQFGKQDQGFLPLWVANHFLKKKLSYVGFYGKGNQGRDVIHIDDVCDIIYLQIKKLKKIYNETFNIGGGKKNYISLKMLTLECEKITKNKVKIKKITKTSNYDVPYFLTNNNKINKFYNWTPKRTVLKIIEDVYEWLIRNKRILKFFK